MTEGRKERGTKKEGPSGTDCSAVEKRNSYGRYNNSSGRGNGYNSILSDVINYCIRFLKERLPEIETAALGNEAGMIGAASLL